MGSVDVVGRKGNVSFMDREAFDAAYLSAHNACLTYTDDTRHASFTGNDMAPMFTDDSITIEGFTDGSLAVSHPPLVFEESTFTDVDSAPLLEERSTLIEAPNAQQESKSSPKNSNGVCD